MQCTIKTINYAGGSMKKMVLAVLLLGIFAAAFAENTNTVPRVASICSECHGPLGNTSYSPWPNLAGQHSAYLNKQLQDYKSGKLRSNSTMDAIAKTLTDKDVEEISIYLSNLPRATGKVPAKYLKRGEQLYRGGDLEKHITACIACHGPNGNGNAEAGFPSLSGQNALYTVGELQDFKNDLRTNDLNGIMRDIAERMNQEDMEAVAYYVQGLH